jgi:hypothetical protein
MKNACDIPGIARQQSQRKPGMVKRLADETVQSIVTLYEHTVTLVAAQPVPVMRAGGIAARQSTKRACIA